MPSNNTRLVIVSLSDCNQICKLLSGHNSLNSKFLIVLYCRCFFIKLFGTVVEFISGWRIRECIKIYCHYEERSDEVIQSHTCIFLGLPRKSSIFSQWQVYVLCWSCFVQDLSTNIKKTLKSSWIIRVRRTLLTKDSVMNSGWLQRECMTTTAVLNKNCKIIRDDNVEQSYTYFSKFWEVHTFTG